MTKKAFTLRMRMAALPSGYSSRRLERALEHVNQHWFPVNPAVLISVRQGLDSGAYDLDILFLIQELKSDFALFTYCLKELFKAAVTEHAPKSVVSDPLSLLRWGGVARIHSILGGERQPPRSHMLNTLDALQGERLRHTAITATTAEVLGERVGIDPEGVFCHALVRQVGLNLIAWNYPTLYARVARSIPPRASLDEELSKELGFSPALLALRVMRPNFDVSTVGEKIRATWNAYDQLCEVGEALARANAPDTYPTAEHDWNTAGECIRRSVGLSGIELIRQRVIRNTAQYQKLLPGTFDAVTKLNPEKSISSFKKALRSRSNPYVDKCPQPTRSALVDLYSNMLHGEVDRAAVERLVKQIIPAAGFTGGCVFVVDPSAMALVPRTRIGKVMRRNLAPVILKAAPGAAMQALVTEHITSATRSAMDLAAAAFGCEQPLIERDNNEQHSSVGAIYSCLGKKRKIGVLYLEPSVVDVADSDSEALVTFKALRQALCDALLVE